MKVALQAAKTPILASTGQIKEFDTCTFGFYSREEVLSLSKVEVTENAVMDPSGLPIPGGASDLAMGAMERSPCSTCGLFANEGEGCPGHFGHIEFPFAFYNPLMLPELLRLAKTLCFRCKKFKSKEDTIQRLAEMFKLGRRGMLDEIELHMTRCVLDDSGKDRLRLPKGEESFYHILLENHTGGQVEEYFVDVPNLELEDLRFEAQEDGAIADELAHKLIHKNEEMSIRPGGIRKTLGQLKTLFYAINASSRCQHCDRPCPPLQKIKLSHSDIGFKFPGILPEDDIAFWRNYGVRAFSDTKCPISSGELFRLYSECLPNISPLLEQVFPATANNVDVFFLRAFLLPPNKFRPMRRTNDQGPLMIHADTHAINRISDTMRRIKTVLGTEDEAEAVPVKKRKTLDFQRLAASITDQRTLTLLGQDCINSYLDSTKKGLLSNVAGASNKGIKQSLEKKEGLFRGNLMGKRVNMSGRSVISPDPSLETNEVGIPLFFATTLVYPEVMSSKTVKHLVQCVRNGEKWPGAAGFLVNGHYHQLNGWSDNLTNHWVDYFEKEYANTRIIVFRHLVNGDPLLMNRQPTLHKASMMAHKAKILKGPSHTLRLHYANCSSYNADFDGDEMNLHAPQDPASRCELLMLCNADEQFITPRNGGPLRGLIQDHLTAATYLTQKYVFFTREEFSQHIVAAIYKLLPRIQAAGKVLTPEILLLDSPSVQKPQELWTGKDLFNAVFRALLFAQTDVPGFNFKGKSKITQDVRSWSDDSIVVIRDTILMQGVLDKNAFGSTQFGLLHALHDAFGGALLGDFFSVMGKMLLGFLQNNHGHTCAYSDWLLNSEAEIQRTVNCNKANKASLRTLAEWVATELNEPEIQNFAKASARDLLRDKTYQILEKDPEARARCDAQMMSLVRKEMGAIMGAGIPSGQLHPFPHNSFATMIHSGAKGSKINLGQISVLLGQQEIAGGRVRLTREGRSLPSFQPNDLTARANGFICNRFLDGLDSQEFFFHAAAGREGLCDTAVKTAKSGYLQRNIIKHLENCVVQYDMTVRDIADATIIQFCYGGDGLDAAKSGFLCAFSEIYANLHQYAARGALFEGEADLEGFQAAYKEVIQCIDQVNATLTPLQGTSVDIDEHDNGIRKVYRRLRRVLDRSKVKVEKTRDILRTNGVHRILHQLNPAIQGLALFDSDFPACRESFVRNFRALPRPMPLQCLICESKFLVTSEGFDSALKTFISKNCGEEDGRRMRQVAITQYRKARCDPGTCVGLTAAHSLGEPSTQMTLNTFHMAGTDSGTVTEGIPRLIELIQFGGKTTTPVLKIPVDSREQALDLKEYFANVRLMECLVGYNVIRRSILIDGKVVKIFELEIQYFPHEQLKARWPRARVYECLVAYMTQKFAKLFSMEIGRNLRKISKFREFTWAAKREAQAAAEKEAEEGPSKEMEVELPAGDLPAGDQLETDGLAHKKRVIEESSDEESEKEEEEDEDNSEARASDVEDDEDPEILHGFRFEDIKVNHTSKVMMGDLEHVASKCKFRLRNIQLPYTRVSDRVVLPNLVKKVMEKPCIRSIAGITRCHVTKDTLIAEGADLKKFYTLTDVPDHILKFMKLTESTTNSVKQVVEVLGIEAGYQSLVNEITGAFKGYGISIDGRHISLLADYMTATGSMCGLNRGTFKHCASAFQAMTYETSLNFMIEAALQGDADTCQGVSGGLTMGKAPTLGTNGPFDVLTNYNLIPDNKDDHVSPWESVDLRLS